jgi:uncharacterized protein (DUF983 family)
MNTPPSHDRDAHDQVVTPRYKKILIIALIVNFAMCFIEIASGSPFWQMLPIFSVMA